MFCRHMQRVKEERPCRSDDGGSVMWMDALARGVPALFATITAQQAGSVPIGMAAAYTYSGECRCQQ